MNYIGQEIRRLRRELVRTNRKLALQRLEGKVADRDPENRRIKLEIGTDPATGEPILSPWVRVQSLSAGSFKISVLPSIGEPMCLESTNGVIGPNSVATFGPFDDEAKRPEHEADELVIECGETRFAMTKDGLKMKSGQTEINLTPELMKTFATKYEFE